jgi:hypothetical protein
MKIYGDDPRFTFTLRIDLGFAFCAIDGDFAHHFKFRPDREVVLFLYLAHPWLYRLLKPFKSFDWLERDVNLITENRDKLETINEVMAEIRRRTKERVRKLLQ